MTYEEIVRRVNAKSSLCSECGCFISSLLDCCPACGWESERKKSSEDRARDSLVETYRALGGNGAVEKIAIQDARTSSYIASLYEKRLMTLMLRQRLYDYVPDIGRPVTLYKDNEPFYTEYVPDVDYTSYYKAKIDALQAQQHTTRLYEDAIKSMKSYSDYEEWVMF